VRPLAEARAIADAAVDGTVASLAPVATALRVDNPEAVRAGVRDYYAFSAESHRLPPELIGTNARSFTPPSQQAHRARLEAHVASLAADRAVSHLHGKLIPGKASGGISSKIVYIETEGAGGQYFKPYGDRNTFRPANEVATSALNDALGFTSVGRIVEGTMRYVDEQGHPFDGPGAIIEPLPEGFRPVSVLDITADPHYADSLCELRVLDYLSDGSDRHGDNVWIHPASGRVMAIDHEMSFGTQLPLAVGIQPISGGRFPPHYTAKAITALKAITPEKIRAALPHLAPERVEAVVLRLAILRRDVESKHPGSFPELSGGAR
jgi:hypothetical protein